MCILLICTECGWIVRYRSTNHQTGLKKYKCPHCNDVFTVPIIKENSINFHDKRNIRQVETGGYMIRKTVNGVRESFGTYPDLKTAIVVREKLKENNWDKKSLNKIRKELNIHMIGGHWVWI